MEISALPISRRNLILCLGILLAVLTVALVALGAVAAMHGGHIIDAMTFNLKPHHAGAMIFNLTRHSVVGD